MHPMYSRETVETSLSSKPRGSSSANISSRRRRKHETLPSFGVSECFACFACFAGLACLCVCKPVVSVRFVVAVFLLMLLFARLLMGCLFNRSDCSCCRCCSEFVIGSEGIPRGEVSNFNLFCLCKATILWPGALEVALAILAAVVGPERFVKTNSDPCAF